MIFPLMISMSHTVPTFIRAYLLRHYRADLGRRRLHPPQSLSEPHTEELLTYDLVVYRQTRRNNL